MGQVENNAGPHNISGLAASAAFRLRAASREVERLRQRRFQARLRRRGVAIGPGCFIAEGSEVWPAASFGAGTRVNGPGAFKGDEPIRIGNYCAIGDAVRMISMNHRTDHANLQIALHERLGLDCDLTTSRGPIAIGHNVWIGDAAIVLDGVTVGDGAVIGAGAIVTKDVPAFAIVVGSPARVVRMRFDPAEIARQSALGWWHWSEERMREHPSLFDRPLG